MSKRLTEVSYWDGTYQSRTDLRPGPVGGFRQRMADKFYETLESLDLAGKRVLEVGGGGSRCLTHLAARYPGARFTALDYSEAGCALMRRYAEEHGVANLDVVCADLFEAGDQAGQYDVVFSLGVVEHFTDLPRTVRAVARFVAPGGAVATFVPNLSGILGPLFRSFNRDVYAHHVVHDRGSLVAGHRAAGLAVEASGYLGSVNFGALSGCFASPGGLKWQIYRQLSRLTTAVWYFESRVCELPPTPLLSPQIYVIARPAGDS